MPFLVKPVTETAVDKKIFLSKEDISEVSDGVSEYTIGVNFYINNGPLILYNTSGDIVPGEFTTRNGRCTVKTKFWFTKI